MSPTPCNQSPESASPMAGRHGAGAAWAAAAAAVLLALAGCAQFAKTGEHLQRQVHEIGCISGCQSVKDRCDDEARFDYQQCEAGYQVAQRDFRWCNSGSEPQCGYPWWSCSENFYGFCANRFRECSDACRQPRRPVAGRTAAGARGGGTKARD